jgi:hypothetical protein
MKIVVFLAMMIGFQTSVLMHIHSMVGYISTKKMIFFKRFMITAISNTLTGLVVAVMVVMDRDIIRLIRIDIILVLESGLIFLYMLFIKGMIVVRIFRRMKDPENYHISYFGKKVYEKRVVDPKEIMTFFITLPFTLFAGAYFVVKLFSR